MASSVRIDRSRVYLRLVSVIILVLVIASICRITGQSPISLKPNATSYIPVYLTAKCRMLQRDIHEDRNVGQNYFTQFYAYILGT